MNTSTFRHTAKALTLILALLLSICALSGCGQSTPTQPAQSGTQSPASSDQTTATSQQTTGAQTEQSAAPSPREITDMAGRVMTVPAEIHSVFSTIPNAAIYLYTLAPDMLLGWNVELNAVERSIILEKYHDLPNFGMNDAINYEAVIAAGPDIAVSVGPMNDGAIDQADKLSMSLGIPVVMVSARLEDAPAVYRFLGDLLQCEDDAEKLALYAETTFGDITDMHIADEDKVRIYYGNGEDSLETAPPGSTSAQIIDLVNGVNAADLEPGDGSRIRVSLEQLLAWDPDVIIVNGEPRANLTGGSAAEAILTGSDFASLKAVQNRMVFGTPNAPFSWIDRPQGPNRIIGLRWLAKIIYPDYFDFQVDDEVKAFFRLFYHVELTDERLAQVYHGM